MSQSNIQLRDYQQECLDALGQAARRGVKRMLVALPTGTGKTVVFSQLPQLIKNGRRMLVVAHREELLDQAAEKIAWANPTLMIGVEQAERHATPMDQVVVASIQTLAVSPKRLEALSPESFAILVIDEAHHATALSYLGLLHRLGLGPAVWSRAKSKTARQEAFASFRPEATAPALIGFTATPSRTDSIGLEAVFDEIAYSRTIEEMMRAGWLCPIIGKRVQSQASLAKVKISHGDFQEAQLSQEVNTPERNELAVKSYLTLAAGRQALCFCVDVKHTQDLCHAFQEAGVSADYVVGATAKDLRQDVIARYRQGSVSVLCNCMVLTEGFDAPETSCIIMARPTKSSLLYTQMLGRGTRIAQGKENLLVIDLVDAGAIGVSSVNTLFGLPPKLETDNDVISSLGDLGQIDQLELIPHEVLANARSLAEVQDLARDFNPLMAARIPEWLSCTLAWVRTSYGYALSVDRGHIGIVEDLLGHATIRVKTRSMASNTGVTWPNAQEAVNVAEKFVQKHFSDQMYFLDRKAPWRVSKDPVTEPQLNLLNKLRVRYPAGLTKGQAGDLISKALMDRGR